jgi:hypothetical protein
MRLARLRLIPVLSLIPSNIRPFSLFPAFRYAASYRFITSVLVLIVTFAMPTPHFLWGYFRGYFYLRLRFLFAAI